MTKRAANLARAARYVRDHGLGPAARREAPLQRAMPVRARRDAAEAAAEAGAFDVATLQTAAAAFRRMVVCTALSARHARAVADEVSLALRVDEAKGRPVVRDRRAQWVVVDAGDTVVHVLTAQERERYKLEELWADGEVGDFPYGGEEEDEGWTKK